MEQELAGDGFDARAPVFDRNLAAIGNETQITQRCLGLRPLPPEGLER